MTDKYRELGPDDGNFQAGDQFRPKHTCPHWATVADYDIGQPIARWKNVLEFRRPITPVQGAEPLCEQCGESSVAHHMGAQEHTFQSQDSSLKCPPEYETATGIWESCSTPDHCAGCGGTYAEHVPTTNSQQIVKELVADNELRAENDLNKALSAERALKEASDQLTAERKKREEAENESFARAEAGRLVQPGHRETSPRRARKERMK